jgi:hypothetical protein
MVWIACKSNSFFIAHPSRKEYFYNRISLKIPYFCRHIQQKGHFVKQLFFPAIFIILCLLSACRVSWSFTGGSVDPNTKTISIHNLKNNAPLVIPTLSQQLTDAVRDKFTSQTKLALVNSGGDLDISGEITNYVTSPISIQANETASQNRLTISIRITFVNRIDENQSFESGFSRFADYPSSKPLSEMDEIIKLVSEYLVDDVFNRAMVNW